MSWYESSLRHLDEALSKLPPDAARADVVKAAFDAYPFGPRKMWPYKMWCKARRLMLWKKFPKLFPPPKGTTRAQRERIDEENPAQIRLFEEC